MNASQLTLIKEAKRILEDCACFRGPEGPQGDTGATGATGPVGPSGTITDFTIPGASTNSLMYYTGSGFGAMSSLFYYSSINVLEVNLNIEPCQNNTYNLGTSNLYWANIYATTYNGIENYNYVSTSGLTSTVRGLGTFGYISSSQLTSTITGLGTFGYISSSQLISTVNGLGNIYVSTATLNTFISSTSYGNVLRVDSVFGNDSIAPTNKFGYPFKTINGAISNISATQTIHVLPGTYNETLVIPTGIAIRGENVQTVTIQSANSTSNTTLITMGTNCRLEDVTMTLYSSNAVDLIGINYPTGTSQNSKLRTTVLNVSSTGATSKSTIGVYSGGTSALSYSISHAIRATTINVASQNSGLTRGLYVVNSNRFSARDTNFSALGTSSIGVETTNISSFAELKQCSINGSVYDINRTAGTIQLSATDLINATANSNSFSVNTEPAPIYFGVVGNIGNGTNYLVPGTVIYNDLPTTFGLPFPQRVIIFQGVFTSGNALTGIQSATFNLRKNGTTGNIFMTATLNSSTQIARILDKSESFNAFNDRLYIEMITSGSIAQDTDLFCALALY